MKKRDIYDIACEIADKVVQIKASQMNFVSCHEYFNQHNGQRMSEAQKDRDTIYRFILGYIK